jgi:hypothetical protein
LQTVGKTYLATTQNIEFATDGRFHPRGLATHAIALDDDAPVPPPLTAPQPDALPRDRVALLLHEDDLHAESFAAALNAAGAQVVAVATPSAGEPRSTLSVASPSPLVASFTVDALADGLERAGDHFAAETTALEGLRSSDVLPWLRAHNLTALVTPYAPVGPVRDRLDRLAVDLAVEGITLTRMLRSWDAHAWPHASRGFFSFRERIPALVRDQQLGIEP